MQVKRFFAADMRIAMKMVPMPASLATAVWPVGSS